MSVRKFVLTGGPHCGKTSVLRELKRMGIKVIPEVPRMIIDQELEKERQDPGYVGVLPGKRQEDFNRLLIEKQIELENSVKEGIVFLDRSLVDPIAYAEFYGVPVEPGLHEYIANAGYEKAFFLDSIPGRLNQEKRTESEEDGQRIHELFPEVYSRVGIDVHNVDIFHIGDLGIKKRVEHILRTISVPFSESE